MKALLGEGRRDSLWVLYSVVDNRVMSPGEEVKIFHVKSWEGARIPAVAYKRIKYTLCYSYWCYSTTNLVGNSTDQKQKLATEVREAPSFYS